MKGSLASYFDEGLLHGFVFWWRLHTLTSYFDDGLAIFCFFSGKWRLQTWLRILSKASMASYFDKGFLLWIHILTKTSHWLHILMKFSYFSFFSEKWRLHTWLRILMKVSLASYFDEGFLIWLRILMEASHLTLYFDEGFTLWLRILIEM
jgi:hypothetical protein